MKKRNISKSLMGKRSRAAGARFELKVRNELESQGWLMDKWTNNVDLEAGKLIKAKRKYNPFMRALSVGTGFPDFICFKLKGKKSYEIIGLEVKRRGYLDKEEREKCQWLLKNRIFSRILIAKTKRNGKRLEVEYVDVEKTIN